MKLFLFLDDWFLDSRIDVLRRYCPAKFTGFIRPPRDVVLAPYWNASRSCYEASVRKDGGLALLESPDGRGWRKAPMPRFKLVGRPPRGCAVSAHLMGRIKGIDVFSSIFDDRYDRDRARRYKALIFPYTRVADNCGGIEGGPGVVACSPDGMRWTMNARHKWFTYPRGSDTANNIFYNPLRKVWQAICRKYNNDRRIFMTESGDLARWTAPRVILHPDALDAPLMQFYGMPAMCYEDEYFIGGAQCYYVINEEQPDETWDSYTRARPWSKWTGTADGQLAYSYDGANWCRSDRSAFLPRMEPDEPGARGVYPMLFRPEKDRIIVYALGTRVYHGGKGPRYLLVYELRKDGFACLEPVAGWGRFSTKYLAPAAKDITLNYQAPHGEIRAQVIDAERKPWPGYTFADSIPLTGSSLNGAVRWKEHGDLSALIGRRIRLEFRFKDARVYALRLNCGLYYTNTPKPIERI